MHSRAKRAGLFAIWFSSVLGACSTDYSRVERDGGAATTDGSVSADGADGASATGDGGTPVDANTDGPRVVFSSTFDSDCGGWNGAVLTPVPNGRTGGGCRFCPSGGGQMFHFPPSTPVSGQGTWTYSVWVKSSLPTVGGGLGMYVNAQDGGFASASILYNMTTNGTQWTRWEGRNPTEANKVPVSAQLDVTVGANDAGVCFIVDDVTLTLSP